MGNFITPVLPHDLPENWNDTQYVSPGGTEVGLTEKHGYNYLMKQVNNSQKAINELDAELGETNTLLQKKAEASTVSSQFSTLLGLLTNQTAFVDSLQSGETCDNAPMGIRKTMSTTGFPSKFSEWALIMTYYYNAEKQYGWQIAYDMNGYQIAYRYRRSSSWYDWKYVSTTDHTHTPASIGAADASILGKTVSAFGEVGVDDVTVVYATLCLKKLTATKCDLHISFKIESNTKDSSKFNFISFSKICSLLGITSVTASSGRSVVKFDPLVSISGNDLTVISRQTPGNMGYSGVHAILSTNGISFGRYYKTDGSYGGWPLNKGLYDAGTYGQIDFYGADYSV